MPELPEVETVRRSLENAVVGARITQVEVGRERTVRRSSKQALIAGLHQETFVAVRRHGKYLLFDLSSGNVMMVHLRMSGRLLLAAPGDVREKHTHVVLTLEKKNEVVRELRFVDPRTFGEVVVYNPDDDNPEAGTESLVPEVARLGLDPLTGNFTFDAFRERFTRGNRGVKALLLDQSVVAGIGNIYADEILHRARLRWNHLSATLSAKKLRELHGHIGEVLAEAVAAGGSTLADTQYVDALGKEGIFQTEHRVYARQGERCRTCGRGIIKRVMGAGRSTHFCPVCQK